MTENRKLKVFLCHSKDDKPRVRKLYSRLTDDGFDVWLDEEKLLPGQDWDLEIRKAVRNSDTVIVCLSESSTTKEGYIQKEIRFALDIADEKPEGTIFFIPARLEVCDVPDRISRFQWVNIFDKSGYSKLTESLRIRMNDLNIRFDSDEILPKDTKDTLIIPILGPIDSGIPLPEIDFDVESKYDQHEEGYVTIARKLLPKKEDGENLFALEVRGDGLIDAMISEGDFVVMKPANKARNGEMVAIWFPRGKEATLKYFFKERTRYRLQPANPAMKPVFARLDEPLEIKGKVVMVVRNMEK